MRLLALSLLAFMWSVSIQAGEVNISTISKDGTTLFYLQAGAFNLEKDAKIRQEELSRLIKEPVIIKNLPDKSLYLVQVGPINEYQTARSLKDQLSKTIKLKNNSNSNSELEGSSITDTSKPPKVQRSETKLWNLRNADVRAVIAEVSRITGKNFVVDPRVQGKISIISTTPMTNDELYQVFLSVLQVSGYAAIPNGEIVKIIPNIDAKTLSSDGKNEMQHPPQGEDMMVTVIPVHYVPADQLVPVIRPLMPQWSNVSAYAPSNMLILSGRANNIKRLTSIIRQVDNSSSAGVDIVHLRYALAMDVANTIKDLIKVQSGSGKSQITISADDKSNSILISGSKTDRIRTRMLLLKLDQQSSAGQNSTTQVVYLNYLRAEDLAPILAGVAQANFSGSVGTIIGTITRPALDSTMPASNLASSGSPGQGSAGPSTASVASSAATANTTTATTQIEGSTKPTIQIIAEPNTNSIVLSAPSSIIRILKTVIKQLDIKPAQILIEAMVAQINESDMRDLGVEWGTNQQAGVGSFRTGFAIINSKTNPADFQAQVYALATQQRANILATPSVVVLDNRQAKIAVGQQISVASTTQNNAATNAGTPFTTFNRVNVTLHIYVRPQITQGQGIQLQIDQGNDTVVPGTALTANPIFNISAIVTSVQVQSGDIVVLGGLTQDQLANNDNGLAILKDVPGIGRLFQRNRHTRDKSVLMVFIKPVILRSEQESRFATGEKYNNTRQYELDWIRSQEVFDQRDSAVVMPALNTAKLPTPFSRPMQLAQVTK